MLCVCMCADSSMLQAMHTEPSSADELTQRFELPAAYTQDGWARQLLDDCYVVHGGSEAQKERSSRLLAPPLAAGLVLYQQQSN
ncbi:hypothetical protein EON63_24820, partial [archaeon]